MSADKGAQESLFVFSEDGQHIVERDLYTEQSDPSISIVERAIHLHNTLGLFSDVNSRRGFVDDLAIKRPEVIRRRYGDNAPQVIAGAEANATAAFTEAKWEFARAFGYAAVERSGAIPEDRLKAGVRHEFGRFWGRFGRPSQVVERNNKRRELEAVIDGYHELVSNENRESGTRTFEALRVKDDRSQLGTRERMRAINGDPRAGFLPVTHNEKNMVLAFLDYQDNPKYQLGIKNQLLEIANSHLRKYGVVGQRYAQEAPISITHELADMLRNARTQLAVLRDLEARIQDCPNPRVTLAEEIGDTHPGYAPLVRYLDLKELHDTGFVAGLKRDPLRTYRNESIVEPELKKEKNKVQEDPYTRTDLRPEFKRRITTKPKQLTIGSMRRPISDAIASEAKRAYYMEARLRELGEDSETQLLNRAGKVARFMLQKLAR